jgi:hypothetical protein
VNSPGVRNRFGRVTFTVDGLSHPTLPYVPAANVQTSVIVAKP